MALLSRFVQKLRLDINSNFSLYKTIENAKYRCLSSASRAERLVPEEVKEQKTDEGHKNVVPLECRFVYPEFLPDPRVDRRNSLREKLERIDMLNRRTNIDISEFYTGSILAVSSSNQHAPEKLSRFVGICIQRGGCGLRAFFILRNVIDHQGVEMFYEMYSPLIQKIEVLRLEKRLDSELLYLRDALPEYSTFPLDMEPEYLPQGCAVPVNPIKVKLKPRPWLERWERQELKGVQDLGLPERFYKRAAEVARPWEKYDLMKEYRESIPAEEQEAIFAEVYSQLQQLERTKKLKRKRTFVRPKRTG